MSELEHELPYVYFFTFSEIPKRPSCYTGNYNVEKFLAEECNHVLTMHLNSKFSSVSIYSNENFKVTRVRNGDLCFSATFYSSKDAANSTYFNIRVTEFNIYVPIRCIV